MNKITFDHSDDSLGRLGLRWIWEEVKAKKETSEERRQASIDSKYRMLITPLIILFSCIYIPPGECPWKYYFPLFFDKASRHVTFP